jgi:hypothetical protein
MISKKLLISIWHEDLQNNLMESGVGGKTNDIINSKYTNNKCVVKIGKKQTHSFPRGETGMHISSVDNV